MRVSIVVPTRNAGPGLADLLAAIEGQECAAEVERIAIDSRSTDGTRERLLAAGWRVLDQDPASYDHGGTRDRAIGESSGERIVNLVQDAVPVSSTWLAGMLRELDDPRVGAAWCRQLPRADCPAVTALELGRSLWGASERRECALEPGTKLEALEPWQRLRLCAFDNVANVVRRSVWEELRFGPCSFAEDLKFARRALERGQTIVFTGDVSVVHSHDRSLWYEARRTYLAHFALQSECGLTTVPRLSVAWSSLWTSGEWMRTAWSGEPSLGKKLARTLRAPCERGLSALAQWAGARDARAGRPPRAFRGV